MPLDFPNAPVANDVYTDTVSGASYTWDGTVWNKAGSGGGGGTTPPAGDFLPLTGGTLTGDLTISNSKLTLDIGSGSTVSLESDVNAQDATDTLWRIRSSTHTQIMNGSAKSQVVNFMAPPVMMGTPIVLSDEPQDGYGYVRRSGLWSKISVGDTQGTDSGDFLPLTGGTLTGNLTFSGANLSVIFNGGSKIYAHTDKAMRICEDSQGRQPQIANNDGGGNRDIIDTTNGDARYLRPTGGTMTGNLTFGSDVNLVMADGTSNIRGIGGNGIHYLVSGNDNHCHGFFASGVLKMHVWNQGVTIYGTFTDALEADIPGSKDEKGGTDIGKTLAAMAVKIKQLETQVAALTAQPKAKK